jgi:mannosyltransferase OCH1-like enzyme
MIPKTLHTVWIGNKPMCSLNLLCLSSMIHHLPPGWRFVIHGNEEAEEIPWVSKAMAGGFPSMACDYLRIHTLLHEGGIYVDADVEIRKFFDIQSEAFIGFQREDTIFDSLNTAVCGGVAGHWFFKNLLDRYDQHEPCASQCFGCTFPTEELCAAGMAGVNKTQMVKDVAVYSRDYFHPKDWRDKNINHITENTVTIHHFTGHWA